MKIKYIIVFLLVIGGCSNFSNNQKSFIKKEQQKGEICLNSRIDSIFRLFLDKNKCNKCVYELYIDKKDPFEYKLTMRSRLSTDAYFKENKPLIHTFIDGYLVYIYSGIEDFIDKNSYSPTFNIDISNKSELIGSWSYVILKDTSYIVENGNNYDFPFINARQAPTIFFNTLK